jgi:hypothetical protein
MSLAQELFFSLFLAALQIYYEPTVQVNEFELFLAASASKITRKYYHQNHPKWIVVLTGLR